LWLFIVGLKGYSPYISNNLVSALVLATLLQISVQAARIILRERRYYRDEIAKRNSRNTYKKKFRKKKRRR